MNMHQDNNKTNDRILYIEEYVKESDLCRLSEGNREFEYKLNKKAAKSKLLKGTKRIPFK
jgi:hypothetical protein